MKKLKNLFSSLLIGIFAIPTFLTITSCFASKPFDLSSLKVNDSTPRTSTVFVYEQKPSEITYAELNSEIARNIAIKEDVLNLIQNQHRWDITIDDIALSLNDGEVNNQTYNYINKTSLNHEILVIPKTNKLKGKFYFPIDYFGIQALPINFKVSLDDIDFKTISYVDPFRFNFINMSEDAIFDTLSQNIAYNNFAVNNEETTLYPYVSNVLEKEILAQLKKIDSSYQFIKIEDLHDFSLDFSHVKEITKNQMITSETSPISSIVNVSFANSQIKTTSSLNAPVHISKIITETTKLDLSNINYPKVDTIVHKINSKELDRMYIDNETIKKDCDQIIDTYVTNIIDNIPVYPKVDKSCFKININYPQNFFLDDRQIEISVKLEATETTTNPLSGSYSFIVPYTFKDVRLSLADKNLIKQLHNLLKPAFDESNTIYINDAVNPKNVTVAELTKELSNNTTLLQKIQEILGKYYGDETITSDDFNIVFFDDSRAPTPGDYTEEDTEQDKNHVALGIEPKYNSYKFKDSTIIADSLEEPITIRVLVEKTKFDLDNLSFDYIGSSDNPFILSDKLDPTNVTKKDLEELLLIDSSGSLKEMILDTIVKEYSAISINDLYFEIISEKIDASNTTSAKIKISPFKKDSKYITGQKTLNFWVEAFQRNQSIANVYIKPTAFASIDVSLKDLNNADWDMLNNAFKAKKINVENDLVPTINEAILNATGLSNVEYNKDYFVDLSYFQFHHQDRYDLTNPLELPAIRVFSNSNNLITKKIHGEFIISLIFKGIQDEDEIVTKNEKFCAIDYYMDEPTKSGLYIHDFIYTVGGVNFYGTLEISYINYEFTYSKNVLSKQIDDGIVNTSTYYTVDDLFKTETLITAGGWLEGEYTHGASWESIGHKLYKNTLHFYYASNGTNTITKYIPDGQKYISAINWDLQSFAGTNTGLYSGSCENGNVDDDIMHQTFYKINEIDHAKQEYEIVMVDYKSNPEYIRDKDPKKPPEMIFGVRGRNNMYKHSNNSAWVKVLKFPV